MVQQQTASPFSLHKVKGLHKAAKSHVSTSQLTVKKCRFIVPGWYAKDNRGRTSYLGLESRLLCGREELSRHILPLQSGDLILLNIQMNTATSHDKTRLCCAQSILQYDTLFNGSGEHFHNEEHFHRVIDIESQVSIEDMHQILCTPKCLPSKL
jgi:hypothetical protein